MKKRLVFAAVVVLFVVCAAKSDAEMRIQPGGITFPDNSTQSTSASGGASGSQILPVAERFEVVLNNEAVLDKETGLVWMKTPNPTTMGWYDATDYCTRLLLGGRKGWRLPTKEALASLIDMNSTTGAKVPDGSPFTGVYGYWYWASDRVAENTFWAVDFSGGTFTDEGIFSYPYRAWCIRGGW